MQEDIENILSQLFKIADFDSSNRAARAYKILKATYDKYQTEDYDNLSRVYKNIALEDALAYARLALS